MPKTYTSIKEMASDPEFIASWTSNPVIVAVLYEAQARYLERQEVRAQP